MNILKFFVGGKEAKVSKQVLDDNLQSSLLPEASASDEGKVPAVDENGQYSLTTIDSDLPVATADDVGKVVSVDENGGYALSNAGGSGGEPSVFRVEFTSEGATHHADKTYAEIVAAWESGLLVYSHWGENIAICTKCDEAMGVVEFIKTTLVSRNGLFTIYSTGFVVLEDGTVEFVELSKDLDGSK